MHIPPIERKWNINTLISVAGFMILLAGMLWTTAQRDRDLTTAVQELAEFKVATDGRLSALEGVSRQIDNLTFRLGAAESTNASISKSLSDLQAAVSQQSGDIRVVREILQRIDRQAGPASYSPLASVE